MFVLLAHANFVSIAYKSVILFDAEQRTFVK